MLGKTQSKHDWGLIASGIFLVLAGFVMFAWPNLSLVMITLIAGVILLICGIFELVSYIRFRSSGLFSFWALISALFSLVLGLVFVFHPVIASGVIPLLLGIFLLIYGVMALVSAITLRSFGPAWGLLLLNALVSVFCAILLIFMPTSFALFLGVFLLVRGLSLCVFGCSFSKFE